MVDGLFLCVTKCLQKHQNVNKINFFSISRLLSRFIPIVIYHDLNNVLNLELVIQWRHEGLESWGV